MSLVRPEFVARMESELSANAQKGDWQKWQPSAGDAINELFHHCRKIVTAIKHGDRNQVSEYAADAANIAMKIDECFGGEKRLIPELKLAQNEADQTDNHNLAAKLELRRYFLKKYHGDKSPELLNVIDCCQGSGLIWRELKKEFVCDSYLGVDLKPQKGRLKIDSVRILDQPGWHFNCIDIDTYGSPWKHWFALLKHAPRSADLTVFLTIGQVKIGGISAGVDNETLNVLGLAAIYASAKSRGVKIPISLAGRIRDQIGLSACLLASDNFGLSIIEAQEAENDGGNARYIGARLTRADS